MRLHLTALVLLALAGPVPAAAQELSDYDLIDITTRFNAGEDAAALEAVAAAEAGNPRAMFILSIATLYGRGVPQDHAAGYDWVRRSAEAGFPRAMVFLGDIHIGGWFDQPVDTVLARHWFERAVALDSPEAFGSLGRMWLCAECGEPDPARAEMLFRRGARMGDPESTYRLGRMIYDRQTAEIDDAEARRLFRTSALQGEVNGANLWGYLAHHGIGGAVDTAEAQEGYQIAIDQGFAESGFNMALLLSENPGLETRPGLALAHCLWAVGEAGAPEDAARYQADCDRIAAASGPGAVKAASGLVAGIGAGAP